MDILILGILENKQNLFNTRSGVQERVQRLLQIHADEHTEISQISAGNIVVALGLKNTRTGDTVILNKDAKSYPIQLAKIPVPTPVFFRTVEPISSAEEKKLQQGLENLMLEDPSLKLSTNKDSGQLVLSGQGELHLEIAENRLLNDWNIKAEFGQLRISYRETIEAQASYDAEINKEQSGKRIHAAMHIQVKPVSEDDDSKENIFDIELDNINCENDIKIDEAREAIIAGLEGGCASGPSAGYPLHSIHITVSKVHVFADTTFAALSLCAFQGLSSAIMSLGTQMLEPAMKVIVNVPAESVGPVLADMNGKRGGQVQSFEIEDTGKLQARVPLAKMIGYATTLRSITEGKGSFTMLLDGWIKCTDKISLI